MIRCHNDQLGVKLFCFCHWHSRVNSKFTRRVRARRHDPALIRPAADSKRLAFQGRLTEFFHCTEKSIQINVDDFMHILSLTMEKSYSVYARPAARSINNIVKKLNNVCG